MSSLSWVTVVWSTIASASLTLAAIYLVVWFKNRRAWLHLLFSVLAVSVGAFTCCELWIMRAETPAGLITALNWGQLALLCLLVSMTWVVASYLHAKRLWLAWTACGLRAVFVLLNVIGLRSLDVTALASLPHVRFLGEPVTVLSGIPNPAMPLGIFSALLIVVFVADASVAAWRRGERRQALTVGGSVEFFLLAGMAIAIAVLGWHVQAPVVFGFLYLGVVAVMGYELSIEVLRASQLVLELQTQRRRLEESNAQISNMFGRLIGAQETERSRIARDLHDDVSQRIAALSIMISGVKRRLGGGSSAADVAPALATMQQSTMALADEIRSFSHNLHPSLLQHAGLDAALRGFCAEFEQLHAIKVTYTADADTAPIQTDMALCLFRIAQEGLRNAARHSAARHVEVTLRRTPAGVHLSIADDGTGFDVARARSAGAGLGLVSMDERARQLRGRVQIVPQAQGGTRVQVEIPLH